MLSRREGVEPETSRKTCESCVRMPLSIYLYMDSYVKALSEVLEALAGLFR